MQADLRALSGTRLRPAAEATISNADGVVSKVRVSRTGDQDRAGGAFRAARSTSCSRIRSTSVRFATSRNAIPGSTRRSSSASSGRRSNSACAIRPRSIGERPTKASPSPLAGKLFDENGEPLYAQGAVKGRRRYRYYVSRDLVRGSANGRTTRMARTCAGTRASREPARLEAYSTISSHDCRAPGVRN